MKVLEMESKDKYVIATLDCGSDIGETLFLSGNNKRDVLNMAWKISAMTNWHFKERCTYSEMQDYMYNCPNADCINVDDYYIEDVNRIIRNFKFKRKVRYV